MKIMKNLRCAKRILVNESEDYNIPKLIDVLSLVDNFLLHLRLLNYKTFQKNGHSKRKYFILN